MTGRRRKAFSSMGVVSRCHERPRFGGLKGVGQRGVAPRQPRRPTEDHETGDRRIEETEPARGPGRSVQSSRRPRTSPLCSSVIPVFFSARISPATVVGTSEATVTSFAGKRNPKINRPGRLPSSRHSVHRLYGSHLQGCHRRRWIPAAPWWHYNLVRGPRDGKHS